jgi:hypothetical protein
MSFKKTITFTANVSDYTDGTVSARVQAENKILGDLVAWILAQGLNILQVEKVSIGDAMWSGEPLNATTGAAWLVNNNSLLTDVYFLGKGETKKCLGLSVDAHTLYAGFTDTATNDMSYSFSDASYKNYGRLPTAQLRALKTGETYRQQAGATVPLASFSTTADALELTLAYYKGEGSLVLMRTDGTFESVAIFADPASVFLYSGTSLRALHYSLTDDATVANETYSFSANNKTYASNAQLQYGMNYSPYYLRSDSSNPWSNNSVFGSGVNTMILMHAMGRLELMSSSAVSNPANGMSADAAAPAYSAYGFPRILNNELYIKKQYIPATYPAVASPVKIGYTPGILYAGTVYQLGSKYYLSLCNGVYGYFVEVADQG